MGLKLTGRLCNLPKNIYIYNQDPSPKYSRISNERALSSQVMFHIM